MLTEVSAEKFNFFFPNESNPFIRQDFISHNAYKTDKIVRLIQDIDKPTIGLVAGMKGDVLISPFSAPFGGFHYKNENMYISEMESFAEDLKNFILMEKYRLISVTFPPSIYGNKFNAKMINALIRKGFILETPELTNWVDLERFEGKFLQRNSREYYQQALRNKLTFRELFAENEKEQAYNLVANNRKRFGRPIYMSLGDILKMSSLWPVDFFGVFNHDEAMLASGIFYQFYNKIAFAVFWGDNEEGRPLRAMDFLSFNLWNYFKGKGFIYVDLGKSTEEAGIPNEGLLRFKETHECVTELKFTLRLTSISK